MLKFVLFAMIGEKLNIGNAYWVVYWVYVVLWSICYVMGWL